MGTRIGGTRGNTRRRTATLLAFPLLCSAALGLWQLGEPSLWIDEAFTARAMGYDYGRLTDELHWLYYTALKPWTTLMGTSEVALRLPSVAGAVLSVGLLYGLTQKLFDARVAFVSSLLLAVNPFVVKWSQQARGYTFVLAVAIASTWLLLRALERERVLRFAEYALASTAMVLLHFFSGLLLVGVHAFVARRSRRGLLWLIPAVLAAWPRAFRMLEQDDDRRQELGTSVAGSPLEWLPGLVLDDVVRALTTVPGAFGVGLVLAALGVLRAGRQRDLLIAWAWLPLALSLAVSAYQPVFLDRYLIVSCPAFSILGGLALVEGLGTLRRPAVVTIAAATIAGLVLWYTPRGGDNWVGENWRAATDLAMREGRGATVTPEWARPAFLYYGGREAKTGWVLVRNRGPRSDPRLRAEFGEWLRLMRP